MTETATSIRLKSMQAELKHQVLAGHPWRQAEAIAQHYVNHAIVAMHVLELLKYKDSVQPNPTPDTDQAMEMLIEQIKLNHLFDLGIALEWPEKDL